MAGPDYLTREGEVLDAIAYRLYGTEQAVHDLLAANPWIAQTPARLPAGLRLTLPPRPAAVKVRTIRLWGTK
jgi:phage tail protein X